MADEKISALPLDATPTGDDLVVTVNDPAGTPVNRKTTMTDVAEFVASTGTAITSLPAAAGPPDVDDGIVGAEDGAAVQFTRAQVLDTAAEILTKLLTVDGAGSGLDADTLDGTSSAGFQAAGAAAGGHLAGTYPNPTLVAASVLSQLLTVDGAGSGLDADLLDGNSSAAFVTQALYDANTILAATADNTPLALTMGASTILARLAAGDIIAATPAQLKTLLAIAGTDVANTPAGTIAATTSQAAIDELGTEKAQLAFGTTTQTFSNTAGRRIAFSNDNTFATNDIIMGVFLNNTDTQPVWRVGTLLGILQIFSIGPGGATVTDVGFTRSSAGVLRVDGFLATPGASTTSAARVAGRTLSNITAVGNVGVGEDTLQTHAVTAAELNVDGRIIRARFHGTAANNANAKRLRFKWAAVTVLDTGALPVSEAYTWKAEMTIVRTGATTQDVFCSFVAGSATPFVREAPMAAGGATLANANNVFVTGEAVSNNDLVSELLTVDWESAP